MKSLNETQLNPPELKLSVSFIFDKLCCTVSREIYNVEPICVILCEHIQYANKNNYSFNKRINFIIFQQ